MDKSPNHSPLVKLQSHNRTNVGKNLITFTSNVSYGRLSDLMKDDKSRRILSWRDGFFVWKRLGIQRSISHPLEIDSKILYSKHPYNYQLRQPMETPKPQMSTIIELQ